MHKIILAFALLCALTTASKASAQKASQTFAVGEKTFLLNNKPFLIKAAEMHYTRIPAEYWEHRIKMCKALGMNTICIYTFWNIHEQQEGEFGFKGQNDIAEFCRLAQKHDMYIILRPGPYVCAEWEMGGLPWWLLKNNNIKLRTNDPIFMGYTRRYINQIGKQLADMQVSRGGNILMVQVENEYGSYATDKEYVANIRDMVREAGFTDVPLFQCDWSSNFERNSLNDLLWTVNFGTGANIDAQFSRLKELRPNTPLMCSEFWSGWFDHWGRKHETRDAATMVNGIKSMLDRNISFSLYMTHGGTTFGHWGGANNPAYSAMCSSYDYDAPINEAGQATDKYHKLRSLMMQYCDSSQVIPDIPAANAVITIPEFTVTEVAPLFDNLPKAQLSTKIKPMEQFNEGWGTILYRTTLPAIVDGTTLLIDEPHDWAQVYVNGKLIGRMDRRRGQNTLTLPTVNAGSQLDILIEAMGRVNFDESIHDRKGITNKVELINENSRTELSNWQVFSFPVDYKFVKSKRYTPAEKQTKPAYYRATFNLDQIGDTFLDLQTWGKGMAWVNGRAMGRFWKVGPQQTLYMPGCWLRKGENEIVILDLLGPTKTTVRGIENPILDMLRAETPATHRAADETLNLNNETPIANGSFEFKSGWQQVDFGKTTTGRYFCLEALNAQDSKDAAAIAELYLLDSNGKPLPRQKWKIAYADSENTYLGNFTADKIFDLQESTYWSTKWSDKYPHQVVIDLGEERDISGFRYLPRAEAEIPGMIKEFRVFVKLTPFTF